LGKVYIFYGHLEYFVEIWNILRPFGTFCIHLVHFTGFGIMHQEKSGNPARDSWRINEISLLHFSDVISEASGCEKREINTFSGFSKRR
jgi:hypothetical protein